MLGGNLEAELKKVKASIEQFINNGLFNEAIEIIKIYESSFPYDPDIFSMKSVIAYYLKNYLEAEFFSTMGLILEPTHSHLLYNLAFSLKQQGKISQARAIFSKGIDYSSDQEIIKNLYNGLAEVESIYQLEGYETKDRSESFLDLLTDEIYKNIGNRYKFNCDFEMLNQLKIPLHDAQLVNVQKERKDIVNHFSGLSYLYDPEFRK